MSSYKMLEEYIKQIRSEKIYIDESNKVIVLPLEEYYLVFQAHNADAWNALKELSLDSRKLKQLFETIESAGDTLIPSSVTIMRIKKIVF